MARNAGRVIGMLGEVPAQHGFGVEFDLKGFPGFPVQHGDIDAHRLVLRQPGAKNRQPLRASGPDDDAIHPGQHRAVHRKYQRQLDLLEEIDENLPVVPGLGQPDFSEGSKDHSFDHILSRH